jgi:glucose/arabinose dehydrogenase
MIGSALVAATAARGATLPPGFSEAIITNALSAPTAMALAPDGRIFVAQQGGALRVIKNGMLLGASFVDLTVDSTGERGLLGVAFDPAFDATAPGPDYVYVYYTVPGVPALGIAPHNRVSRFTASEDAAVVGSEVQILNLEDLGATNHNGGAIHFRASDGKLYVAVGENAIQGNSQLLTNRLGKMLRVNSDGTIPPDNPYVAETDGLNEAIWAIGLRNPFTFAFQPGPGSRMFINDVGSGGAPAWEEINDGIAHSNYGWPDSEGPTTNPLHTTPLYAYQHGTTPNTCAITGGAFYNPTTAPFGSDYVGDYFFADLCAGWIRRFDPANPSAPPADFASGVSFPVDLVVDDAGRLYYLARGAGSLYRVTKTPTAVLAHSFRAKRSSRGVVLTWRSEPNLQVLGFNLYRVDRGARVRLNRELIVAEMRSRYSYTDRRPARAGRYLLQVVFANGTRTWIGPLAVA